MTEVDEPETAFPGLTEAAGCPPLADLTPDEPPHMSTSSRP